MIKFTKTELRDQQHKLTQLQKYLPTLQLKKALLQLEVELVVNAMEAEQTEFDAVYGRLNRYASLFSDRDAAPLFDAVTVKNVEVRFENIAGTEVPYFEKIDFAPKDYSLFDTPFWMENAGTELEHLISSREKMKLLQERRRLLEKELRDVSIRVNLFEKILIPRTQENIRRIRIFLGDQLLAAVSQAKVSKRKILERRAS